MSPGKDLPPGSGDPSKVANVIMRDKKVNAMKENRPQRQLASNIPLLEKEGWTRHQRRYREATFDGADGVVGPAKPSGLKI
jgi:hypothetical protein